MGELQGALGVLGAPHAGRDELQQQREAQPECQPANHTQQQDLLALRARGGQRHVGALDDARVGKLQILRLGRLLVAGEHRLVELLARRRLALQLLELDGGFLRADLLLLELIEIAAQLPLTLRGDLVVVAQIGRDAVDLGVELALGIDDLGAHLQHLGMLGAVLRGELGLPARRLAELVLEHTNRIAL